MLIMECLEYLWVLNIEKACPAEFIVRDMEPLVVILCKAVASFRKHIFSNDNILVRTVVDNIYFIFCRLSRRWSKALFVLH